MEGVAKPAPLDSAAPQREGAGTSAAPQREGKAAAPQRQSDNAAALVQATAEMLASQARQGMLTALAGGAALGLLLVPAIGWLRYLAWYGVLVAAFVARHLLLGHAAAHRTTEGLVALTAYTSAATALLHAAPPLLFFDLMSPATQALYTAVIVAWILIGATVIGIHPQSYRLYVVTGYSGLALAWWWHAPGANAGVVSLLLALAGRIAWRFSAQLRRQFEDAVDTRYAKEALLQQLADAVARKDAAERERSQLLAAASHDLLQPVHAMLLLTGLLSRTRDEARRDEFIARIQATANSIDAMFRGLLDQARIDAGRLTARSEPVQLQTLVRAVQAAAEPRCAQLGLALKVDCAAQLWALGDATLIERVLRNLMDNALKFTPQGSVALACGRHDAWVTMAVTDTGIGIDADELDQVRRAFYRGRAALHADADGLGLGLANATRMVELMGGELAIESAPGQGSSMTVRLPAAHPPAPISAPAAPVRTGLRYRRVLVIDDDRAAREALSLWIEAAGGQVRAAPGLGQALAQCAAHDWTPELLMVDYQLGSDADGLAVITRLRQRFGWLPAMLITGEPIDEAALPCDVRLLRKPLHPEQLDQALSHD